MSTREETQGDPSSQKFDPASGRAVDFLPMLYEELRRVAAVRLHHERQDHTLQPTALVHEVFLKLNEERHAVCNDRAHFFALAARTIHRVLVDHERRRAAIKRAAPTRVPLSGEFPVASTPPVDVLALHEALEKLGRLSERQARITEMRFFADMPIDEIAEVLGISGSTVKADWQMARAWLARELSDEPA